MSHNAITQVREKLKALSLSGIIIAKLGRMGSLSASQDYLRWATDFTGSQGVAVITLDQAWLYVDGRYTLQAQKQAPQLTVRDKDTLFDVVLSGSIAFDPWVFSEADVKRFQNAHLVPEENFFDALWTNRPVPDVMVVEDYPYAGESTEDKRSRVAATLTTDALLLTDSESVSWLLNIRNTHNTVNPVVPYAVIIDQKANVDILTDHDALLQAISAYETLGVSQQAPYKVTQTIKNPHYVTDPVEAMKAVKNDTEIEYTQRAHIYDGVALTEFLYWLEHESQDINEIEAAEKLLHYRTNQPSFRGVSFPTISAVDAHGAIVHYQPTPETNAPIAKDAIYLIDSGGQYDGATTDVTRTVLYQGSTHDKAKHHYTLVLKGHIALASCRFPVGTCGSQLDALARQFLWQQGCDYQHGTGHGVSNGLCVHEGPQAINKINRIPLEASMIVSIEPGYYGDYGIRLENLAIIKLCYPRHNEEKSYEGNVQYLEFETLTLAPFDPRLIHFSLLTDLEKTWLKHYHERVLKELSAMLSPSCHAWLVKINEKIGEECRP